MKLQLSIQRNYKLFYFQQFPKTEVYLEPSQTSKMKPLVKIVNGLMRLTNFTKSCILDVSLVSKNATKILIKTSLSSTFLALAAIWL